MNDPHTNFITGTYLQAEGTWNTKYVNLSEAFKRKETPSQNGEGGLINDIFERCLPQNKWCFEAGVGDGFNLSNTNYLLKNKGWNGVLIENDPKNFDPLKECYKGFDKVHIFYESLTEDNLESYLNKCKVPLNFDLFSLDIDSPFDDKVWENLKNYRPNLVCIEIDAFEHDLSVESFQPVIVESDGRVGGHSLGKMMRIAKQKGYDYLCANYCNAFFIEPEFAKPIMI